MKNHDKVVDQNKVVLIKHARRFISVSKVPIANNMMSISFK